MTTPPPRPERTVFVRPVPKRPHRFWSEAGVEPHVGRTVPTQPARFAVGLDDFDDRAFPRDPPSSAVHEGVIELTRYVGRVLSVGPDREVLVRVWHSPSGAEGTTALSLDDFPGEQPMTGSLVHLWAWLELPGKGQIVRRRHVEVENRAVDSKTKAELANIAAALERASHGGERGD